MFVDNNGADDENPSPASGRGAGERDLRDVPMRFSAENRVFQKALSRAKQMRRHPTDAEQHLWFFLRAHRFMGLKFRRQKPIGPYIADFVCVEHCLIIEVDGGQHCEPAGRDRRHEWRRNAYFEKKGLQILRFWNNEVLLETEAVLEAIRLQVEKAPSPLTPLPLAGEGTDRM